MAPKRVIEVSFWTDPYVIEKYSVEDKYFILYLMTNPATTQIGIYRLSKKVMGFETGYSSDVIDVLIDRFEKQYKEIIYNPQTQELSLLNSLTYSIMKGGNPVADLLKKELSGVLDANLIYQTYCHLQEFFQNSIRPFDQTIKQIFEDELTKRNVHDYLSSKKIHNTNQNQTNNHNYNQNDNDNHNHIRWEESSSESSTESQDITNTLNKGIIYYEHHFGNADESTRKELEFWSNELSEQKVVSALSLSKQATNPLNYAIKILNNWKHDV